MTLRHIGIVMVLVMAMAIAAVAAPNSVLSQLGARGVTTTSSTNTVNGTNVYYRYLLLLGETGTLDAGFMPQTTNTQVGFGTVKFIDAGNGSDNTNVFDGSIIRPYKSLTNAVAIASTNTTYVLAPGSYLAPTVTNPSVTRITLIGLDPANTAITGQFRIENDRVFWLNVTDLSLEEVQQMDYRDLNVDLRGDVSVSDQIHVQYPASPSSILRIQREPRVRLAVTPATNAVVTLSHSSTNIAYAVGASANWGSWTQAPATAMLALDYLSDWQPPRPTNAGQIVYWSSSNRWGLISAGGTNHVLYGGTAPRFANPNITYTNNSLPYDFVPAVSGGYSVGTAEVPWSNGWFSTAVYVGGTNLYVALTDSIRQEADSVSNYATAGTNAIWIDGTNRFLPRDGTLPMTGALKVDQIRRADGSAAGAVFPSVGILYDSPGNESIDYISRWMKNSGGLRTLRWNDQCLTNSIWRMAFDATDDTDLMNLRTTTNLYRQGDVSVSNYATAGTNVLMGYINGISNLTLAAVLTNGSRAMQAPLNMGTNDITNVTAIAGVGSNAIRLWGSVQAGESTTRASGLYSFAYGYTALAQDTCSRASGFSVLATGVAAQAEGMFSKAYGEAAHAEGRAAIATNDYAHAEGYFTLASGWGSHAEGSNTVASGTNSHAEGIATLASAWAAHAQGHLTWARGVGSHAEGFRNEARARYSHAEGGDNYALGDYSHVEGYNNQAVGAQSHAEGSANSAMNDGDHAEGYGTAADGPYAHAEGDTSYALGYASHAEGQYGLAYGDRSHAEGYFTLAAGEAAHAEGYGTVASGKCSHAQGYYTIATGECAFAGGSMAWASNDYSFVWADGGTVLASTLPSQWMVRASSGFNWIGQTTFYSNILFSASNAYSIGTMAVPASNVYAKNFILVGSGFYFGTNKVFEFNYDSGTLVTPVQIVYQTDTNTLPVTYLTNEPAFLASIAYNITSGLTNQWSQAYGWGNHALAGYLTTNGNGSALTNLNATQLLLGTVPLDRLAGITSNQIDAATDTAYRNGVQVMSFPFIATNATYEVTWAGPWPYDIQLTKVYGQCDVGTGTVWVVESASNALWRTYQQTNVQFVVTTNGAQGSISDTTIAAGNKLGVLYSGGTCTQGLVTVWWQR